LQRSGQSAADHGVFDFQCIHQRDNIGCYRCLLTIPEGFVRKKPRSAVAAQMRHDHPVTRVGKQCCAFGVAMDVVRPAVQQNHRLAIRRTRFRVTDIQYPGFKLFDFVKSMNCRTGQASFVSVCQGLRRHDLCCCDSESCKTQKVAAAVLRVISHVL
jgi:hypothetical protein